METPFGAQKHALDGFPRTESELWKAAGQSFRTLKCLQELDAAQEPDGNAMPASERNQQADVYSKELLQDEELLALLGVSAQHAAQGLLLLEALSINALWDFGIPFERVRTLTLSLLH